MKIAVKKFLPLAIMMILLVLVLSMLPQYGTVDLSTRAGSSMESMNSVALTSLERVEVK